MSTERDAPRADQIECTRRLLAVTPDAAVVSNLGVASYVLAGVADRERNFYLWGSMGVTTPVGLGLAASVDCPVTVLDGDGSLLMSLGALSTVASHDPPNLTVVVWDNRRYQTTGGQPSPSEVTPFDDIVAAFGLSAYRARTDDEFEDAYADAVEHDGASVVVCDVEPVDPDSRPPMDFAYIKHRFRTAMGEADR